MEDEDEDRTPSDGWVLNGPPSICRIGGIRDAGQPILRKSFRGFSAVIEPWGVHRGSGWMNVGMHYHTATAAPELLLDSTRPEISKHIARVLTCRVHVHARTCSDNFIRARVSGSTRSCSAGPLGG